MVLTALSQNQEGAPLVQAQTLPLFENLALIIVVALAVYVVFRA